MINLTLACKKYNVIYFEDWHSVQSKNQRMALRLFVTVQISWNKKIKKTSICIQVCYVYIFFSTLNSFCLPPQLVDFEAHFSQAEKDIEFYIPDEDFSGYAVIGKC